uniref:Olfactory receptor n=1 Tax=Glyphodes pyloalis TaxID=1242752 RepID=A0A6M3GUJ3_GLYPY|nr:olfactory receptor [Glyphodes pyloalis]
MEDPDTIGKSDPKTLVYIKQWRLMLWMVGAWPDDAVNDRPRRPPYFAMFLLFETSVVIAGQIYFILTKFRVLSFIDIGDAYIALALSFLVGFRTFLLCFKTYGTIFWKFLRKFHLMHFKHKNEYWEEVYHTTNKVSTYFTKFMIWLAISGAVSVNITPLYQNYRLGVFQDEPPENVSAEFSVHYSFPGFKQEDFYLFVTVANLWISYVSAFIICTMDLALYLMIIQIIGHINTLIHTLRNFPEPQKVKELHGFKQKFVSHLLVGT